MPAHVILQIEGVTRQYIACKDKIVISTPLKLHPIGSKATIWKILWALARNKSQCVTQPRKTSTTSVLDHPVLILNPQNTPSHALKKVKS